MGVAFWGAASAYNIWMPPRGCLGLAPVALVPLLWRCASPPLRPRRCLRSRPLSVLLRASLPVPRPPPGRRVAAPLPAVVVSWLGARRAVLMRAPAGAASRLPPLCRPFGSARIASPPPRPLRSLGRGPPAAPPFVFCALWLRRPCSRSLRSRSRTVRPGRSLASLPRSPGSASAAVAPFRAVLAASPPWCSASPRTRAAASRPPMIP